MGFPGQTSRHHSSYALEFYRDHQIPITIEAYEAIWEGLRHAAEQDSQAATKNAAQRASVGRTLDYYQHALQGFSDHKVVENKRQLEKDFTKWMEQDTLRIKRYRRVLPQLDQAYSIASQTGKLLYATFYTLNNNRLFELADLYHSYRKVLDDSTNNKIVNNYKKQILNHHKSLLNDINIEAQRVALSKMLYMLATLPDGEVIFYLLELFGDTRGEQLQQNIDSYLDRLRQNSIAFNLEQAKAFLNQPIDSARSTPPDDFVTLYQALIESHKFSRKNFLQHIPYRNPARERYVSGMREFRPQLFPYPDANGTLRLSVGHVGGYSPKGGSHYLPFTYISDRDASATSYPNTAGFINTDNLSTDNGNIPANFLSDNDITGGNEGSPVLNKQGNLVGLSFNNIQVGVVADYSYTPNIQRAINIDIRYILFLLYRYPGTERIFEELDFTNSASNLD
jgi:hypothetical protein